MVTAPLSAAFEQLDTFVVRAMHAYNTPGLALALTDREKLLRVTAYGYADLAPRTPVTAETRFETGSDGKAFTALALLQQVEAGRVDLHAPVSTYLPLFHVPSRFAPITVHHLLSHSAGLIYGTDFAPDGRYEAWALREMETRTRRDSTITTPMSATRCSACSWSGSSASPTARSSSGASSIPWA